MEVIKRGSTSTTSTTTPSSLLARNTVTRFAMEIFDDTSHFGNFCAKIVDSNQNKLYMKKRLFRFSYVSDTTMNDHITNFNQLDSDLMNMHETFKDEDLALMLLGSLPEEFEFLKMALLHGKNDVSLREETGHWKKDCQNLKTKGKSDNGKTIAESAHHMCPHQDWFFDFKELSGGVVCAANNIPLTTFGIGSVRLNNQDGSIITLIGVRFVPELMKNLIYVGTLESKGFEVRAKDGVMKIISGARVVIKGIWKNNNLYHYSGSTVIGTIAATSTDDQEDVTFDESTMLKRVDVEQSNDGPKQVEFERVVIPADEATDEDSSISEGERDSEGEQVQTQDFPQ
ncbi:hypothetical protein Salat_1675600 [Sesamum alatum]|uniref:Retrovirus-related Pol polyprotein from transposon TNT 1-94-like beta-barrel domain-containing protein n=1 Tax=Sesamum alatum TaxID=300844 RepID=A0AAE2CJU4_9LAMI|nr:hypothetical protein Salat_1675600 [Sesamum alatum]